MKGFIITAVVLVILGTFGYFFFWDHDMGENGDETVYCTMDAMLCPDGSYVGRVPPSCQFAECPTSSTSTDINIDTNINAS